MQILYFAWLRERIGASNERVSPPEGVTTPRGLAEWLAAREPRYAEAFADLDALRVAIDQRQAEFDDPLGEAGEVAFFPPVTGG